MKYVLVIGDGMADRPVEALGGKTPLMVAKKPCIDALARAATVGLARTVPHGVPAGSDTAILSIFGYDPRDVYTGRSPLEAAGIGAALKPGNLSFRCNLVSIEPEIAFENSVMRSHSGGQIEGEEALTLMRDLCRDEAFGLQCTALGMTITATPTFRHIAVLTSDAGMAPETTPPHDILGRAITDHLPTGGGSQALRELMRCAHRALSAHPINARRVYEGKVPANAIWLWGQGRAVELSAFPQRWGHSGPVVSAVPLVKGIARLAGLPAPEVPGATGEIDTDYAAKVRTALTALGEGCDFAALHVEAPDECGHNGDLPGKITAIEYLDDRLMRPLLDGLDAMGEPYRLLLLSDHSTPLSTRTHGEEPIPYLLFGSQSRTGCGAESYDEHWGALGELVDPGTQLMEHLFAR